MEKPEPANPPDSAATSDYSDRLYLLHRSRRRDHPGRACASLPSVEERHSAKVDNELLRPERRGAGHPCPPREYGNYQRHQVDRPRRSAGEWRARAGRKVQERRARASPRPKTECPTKGTPQRTPLKGQGKAHRGPRPFPHTFGYVCLLLSNDECWMQIV